jgi:hypothetical protein
LFQVVQPLKRKLIWIKRGFTTLNEDDGDEEKEQEEKGVGKGECVLWTNKVT